jgi:hypothetical protein
MSEVIEFFGAYKPVSVILHVLSVIVGMGSALVSDIFFNIFIKDKKIQAKESYVLDMLSVIVWFSLAFIFLSGFAIFLSDPLNYFYSTKFLVKMTVVTAIIINGYLFWRLVHPALHKLNFTDKNMHHKYVRLRKVSFALGAISLASWMSAFVLGMLGDIPFSYAQSITGYLVICFAGIIVSQIMEYRMTHK